MKIDKIILRPILTEKATDLANKKVYTFEVNSKADKTKIKKALEKLYKIKVSRVGIIKRHGKKKKTGRKMLSKKQSDKKIALVTVEEGKIDLFPQT